MPEQGPPLPSGLFVDPKLTPEQERAELNRRMFVEWIDGLVKSVHKKTTGYTENIKKVQESLSLHLLELPRIAGALNEFGLKWGDLKAEVSYSNLVELSVVLPDGKFREWYAAYRDQYELRPYTSEATVIVQITEKVGLEVRAESLKREDLQKKPGKLPASVSDDLPL